MVVNIDEHRYCEHERLHESEVNPMTLEITLDGGCCGGPGCC